jgi:hypothetical protein
MVLKLIDLLQKTSSPYGPPVILAELSNVKELVSSRDVIKRQLPLLAKYKETSGVTVQALEDWANMRFEKVEEKLVEHDERLDELDAKINALNARVSETCHNFEEVKGAHARAH